jgi:hypothetical protein
MNFRGIPLLMAMSFQVGLLGQAAAPTGPQENASNFIGVWRGQMDSLPGVDLVITDEGGQVRGAVLFYLHMRQDVHSPYTSTPGLPEPMFDLKLEGQTLKFDVSHRRAHPPRTLHDPPVAFDLKLTGPDKAELVNEMEGGGPALVLTRSDH